MVHQRDNWRMHRDTEWMRQMPTCMTVRAWNNTAWIFPVWNWFLTLSVRRFINSTLRLKLYVLFFCRQQMAVFHNNNLHSAGVINAAAFLSHANPQVCLFRSELCKISLVLFSTSCCHHTSNDKATHLSSIFHLILVKPKSPLRDMWLQSYFRLPLAHKLPSPMP